MHTTTNAQVKIGVFADCQYCDCEKQGNRYYKNSISKLRDCIHTFNAHTLDFVVGLGDLIDRDYKSFEKVNSVLKDSKHPVHNVTGNHDYSVEEKYLHKVPSALKLESSYYVISKMNWQFIFLNGNELSLQSQDPVLKKEATQLLAELTKSKQPNNKEWNGGLGDTQRAWLDKQLRNAKHNNMNVVLFCHYPLLPHEAHTLWDSKEVLNLISKYKNVKAWVNGHNHAGNYAMKNGVHFVTMKGMVDTENENAFSTFTFNQTQITVEGFHRESERVLLITK